MAVIHPLFIIASILSIGALVLIILALYLKQPKYDYSGNKIRNFMPQYCFPITGFASGIIIRHEIVNDRHKVTFIPDDVDREFMKSRKDIPEITIIVEKNKWIPINKNSFSERRTEFWALPPTPEDFPYELKNTPIGQQLMKMTEKINTDNIEIDVVREGSRRKDHILERSGDRVIDEAFLDDIEDLVNVIKKMKEDKHPTPSSTYQNPKPSYS